MKTKFTLLLIVFLSLFSANAQKNEACMEKLSLFSEAVKIKNYEAAFTPWMFVRKTCPTLNNAIYTYGEKILKHKIKLATGAEKTILINDLIALYKESVQHMPSKYKVGKTEAKIGQLLFDQKIGTLASQFEIFDHAFKTDSKSFQNPKAIYTYFKLEVDMYDMGDEDFQHLVNLYSVISNKIELENKRITAKVDALLIKVENGSITAKEKRRLKSYNSFLKGFSQIAKGVDKELGDRANCDKLVPLFEKNFEANKTNLTWLRKAASRLAGKDCADAPLFKKLVKTFHYLEPSAKTAYYLGMLSVKKGDITSAEKYYNESANLNTDGFDKAKVYYKLAVMNKKRGKKTAARTYANKALSVQPSFGKAYLLIANMYASSANSCGTTTFEKRATFWLAANTAIKAGKVSAALKSLATKTAASYNGKAPSREDVFSSGKSGQTIKIGCWIGRSVKVPAL